LLQEFSCLIAAVRSSTRKPNEKANQLKLRSDACSIQLPTYGEKVKKFFLMTRGRTGSTAIVDELNRSRSLRVTQELFLKYNFEKPGPYFHHLYDLVLPFVLWKQKEGSRKWTPSRLWSNHRWADDYLAKAEALAGQQGAASFGFKVLSHNFDEWPFLSALLKRRGYRVIYLTRNLARQVLSGMVANQRGIWNTREDIRNVSSYFINLDEFQRHVEWERKAIENDLTWLTAEGSPFISVTYEEFCTNRLSFYTKIFHFLELPAELPPRSDWSVLIKDLRSTIANYDTVIERAAVMGIPLDS
jgi:hypothetical protein